MSESLSVSPARHYHGAWGSMEPECGIRRWAVSARFQPGGLLDSSKLCHGLPSYQFISLASTSCGQGNFGNTLLNTSGSPRCNDFYPCQRSCVSRKSRQSGFFFCNSLDVLDVFVGDACVVQALNMGCTSNMGPWATSLTIWRISPWWSQLTTIPSRNSWRQWACIIRSGDRPDTPVCANALAQLHFLMFVQVSSNSLFHSRLHKL